MKKTRKIFLAVSAITLLFSNSFIVCASESQTAYDLKNSEYIEYINKHEKFEYDEKLFNHFGNQFYEEYSDGSCRKLVNIYKYPDNNISFLFELEYPNGIREFIENSWVVLIRYNDEGDVIKQDELDKLTKENNLEHLNVTVQENGNVVYENNSFEDMIKLYNLILNNFENYTLELVWWLYIQPKFSDTIGDADIDGELTVRDASHIAKELSKTSAGFKCNLPINADYNKDGNLNIRDAAAVAAHLAKI